MFTSDEASATLYNGGYLETPKGVFKIVQYNSNTEVVIRVPTTYTNESGVICQLWTKLFHIQSQSLQNTPSYTLYEKNSIQPAMSMPTGLRIGIMFIPDVTANPDGGTVYSYFRGTDAYSHFWTPMTIEHNDLVGLQGGGSYAYYHLASTPYSHASVMDQSVATTGTPTFAAVYTTGINKCFYSPSVTTRGYTWSEAQVFTGTSITTWTSVKKISVSTVTSLYASAIVEARIGGTTNGIGTGVNYAKWQIVWSNAAPAVAMIVEEKSASYAPKFKLAVSSNDVLLQVESSDATNYLKGQIYFDIYFMNDVGNGTATFTVAAP
jgi:outer membrane lipoprotein SlyB